jgi:protein-disulfide isomerase
MAIANEACEAFPKVKKGAVVGSYGDKNITVEMVDAALKSELCKAKFEYDKKVNELREGALQQLVDEGILSAAVKAKGVANVEALLKSEVSDKLAPPTEAKMKAEYEGAKDRLPPGVTYEQIKGKIRDFLASNATNEATAAYLGSLRKKSKITNNLPVFRVKVGSTGPSKGPTDARVVILEFADFECPYCDKGNDTMGELLKKYPKDVRVVYKDFPLDFHQNAVPAAVGARCAGLQGKYWAMHQKLFDHYDQLSLPKIDELATSLGLDMKVFTACKADPKHAQAVEADQAEGAQYGVEGTPAFFVNGIPLSGAQPIEVFSQIIDKELGRIK